MKTLTEKQKEVLIAMEVLSSKKGYQPSIEDLSDMMGVSKGTVYQRLRDAEKKGYIKRHGSRAVEYKKKF